MKTPTIKIPAKFEPKPIPTKPMKYGGAGMKKSKGKC
jgi:hypothetical protein